MPYAGWTRAVYRMRHGGFALLDQMIFSASNFLLNLFLLRWLTNEDYGHFAMVYASILIVGSMHRSIVIAPMMTFAAGRFSKVQKIYLTQVVIGVHLIVLLIATLAAFLLCLGIDVPLDRIMIPIGASILFAVWTARKACYAAKIAGSAWKGSLVYTVLLLGAVAFMHGADSVFLTIPRIFLAISVAGVGALLIYGYMLSLGIPTTRRRWIGAFLRRHLRYGRWSLGSAVIQGASGNLILVALGLFQGVAAVALVRAAQTLLLPLMQLSAWSGSLMLPYLVSVRSDGQRLRRAVRIIGAGVGGIGLLYCAVLFMAYPIVNSYVLNGKYSDGRLVLGILAVAAILGAYFAPRYSGLAALERPDTAFWAQLAGGTTALVAGLILMMFFKAPGAAAGFVFLIALPGSLVHFGLRKVLAESSFRSRADGSQRKELL